MLSFENMPLLYLIWDFRSHSFLLITHSKEFRVENYKHLYERFYNLIVNKVKFYGNYELYESQQSKFLYVLRI